MNKSLKNKSQSRKVKKKPNSQQKLLRNKLRQKNKKKRVKRKKKVQQK